MNALDDDLRVLFELQADAMQVPPPIVDRPVARVTSLDARRPRRWLLAAAAIALVGAGGLALAQRDGGTPADPAEAPPAAPAFLYETPTVRMSADTIEVAVGDHMFVPHNVAVSSDPGDAQYTTLELEWTDAGVGQRIYLYFASDGTQWWATEIRTYGDPGDDRWITTEGQWFTSPLGTAWTGDLDLPNLKITGMTLEAFRRPDACDHPTSPLAVVFPYPAIDGALGTPEGDDGDGSGGFAGVVQVIDTATCTVLDPSGYTLDASVDDPTIAVLYDSGIGAVGAETTVAGADTPVGTAIPAGTVPAARQLRVDLSFHAAGTTTLRLTVRDAAGAEVGTVLVPITIRAS